MISLRESGFFASGEDVVSPASFRPWRKSPTLFRTCPTRCASRATPIRSLSTTRASAATGSFRRLAPSPCWKSWPPATRFRAPAWLSPDMPKRRCRYQRDRRGPGPQPARRRGAAHPPGRARRAASHHRKAMILSTTRFGALSVDETQFMEFPEGLPGFKRCRRFVPFEHAECAGLIFLQSMDRPDLCFLTLPGAVAAAGLLSAVDAGRIANCWGCPPAGRPRSALKWRPWRLLSLREGQPPTANLLSPDRGPRRYRPRRAGHPPRQSLRLPRAVGV